MNFDTNVNLLTDLTKHLHDCGLNYEVTFIQESLEEVGTTVEIIDELTGRSLIKTTGENLENALFKGLSTLASRVYNSEMLSVM